jgi:acyl carrier protein
MKTPTRTPEGVPGNCPLCDAVICLEPSGPVGDAPCPYCGHLLWFVQLAGQVQYYSAEDVPATRRQKIYDVIANWARDNEVDLNAVHELDSFDLAQLFLELESELCITITEKDARELRTLGDVIDHLVREE